MRLRRPVWLASLLLLVIGSAAPAQEPVAVVSLGLASPQSVAIAADGTMFVALGGAPQSGDGSIVRLERGTPIGVATGLDNPTAVAEHAGTLYVCDGAKLLRIAPGGKPEPFGTHEWRKLTDVAVDATGRVFVTDQNDPIGVYEVLPDGKVEPVSDPTRNKTFRGPTSVLATNDGHLLVHAGVTGELFRLNLEQKFAVRWVHGHPMARGVTVVRGGKVVLSTTDGPPVVFGSQTRSPDRLPGEFQSAGDMAYDARTHHLIVPDPKAGRILAVDLKQIPAAAVDESPLDVQIVRAFPNLTFDRPIVLTHFGDGSNQIVVAEQRGKILVFNNDDAVTEPKDYADLSDRVTYKDRENEEGFLGLAFPDNYRFSREFFAYYTATREPHLSVVSRFKVQGKKVVEDEILTIPQPYWNHNGGTIAFGPDRMLYVALGDGGKGGDPHGNGQNLSTWLGSILRIDVNQKDPGKNYAVPADNPFRGQADARPEIFAYGCRNIWRMSFDRSTGELWAADVGQDLWEEINLVTPGTNLGWNLREGKHKFQNGADAGPKFLEPILEYHHDLGKSITGGFVYRGTKVPALRGHYIYADYVTGQVWALKYDPKAKRVTAIRPIVGNISPVMSFGEDEQGEVYFLTVNGGAFRFAPGTPATTGASE